MKRGCRPIRQCVGCGARRPQTELIRLKACGEAATVSFPKDGRPGRGCYICPREDCVEIALKKGRVQRALRRNVAVVPSKEELLNRARGKGVAE